MIPITGWSSDTTTISRYATYGLTKPVFLVTYPFELELGPIILNASGGNIAEAWWLFTYTDGMIHAERYNQESQEYEDKTVIVATPSVLRLSATFDQLGRPLVFFDTGEELRLFWYDPLLGENVTTVFGEGSHPFATFDIRWDTSNPNSDVLLFYIRAGGIYYRLQRDRYTIEHSTPVTQGARILEADMTVDYRLQLLYR